MRDEVANLLLAREVLVVVDVVAEVKVRLKVSEKQFSISRRS